MKWLWEHSYKVAFFAYNLARNFRKKKDLLDDAYVGGILHDMGKIIFSNVHPDLLEKINRFCERRGIEGNIFEDLSAGLNHAEIGGRIAEKWNFPSPLIESIRFHHEPVICSPGNKEVVFTVYLANALVHIADGELDYDHLNNEVLQDYGIRDEQQVRLIVERLQSAFEHEGFRH